MFKIGSGFLAENPPHVKIAGAETAPGSPINLNSDRPDFRERAKTVLELARLKLSPKPPPPQGGPKLSPNWPSSHY